MNNSLTRRSFMKRSVVAAVAASNLTLFSGLVNANNPKTYTTPPYDCDIQKFPGWFGDGKIFPQNQEVPIMFCQVSNPNCNGLVQCGRFYRLNALGHVILNSTTGLPITDPVVWLCDRVEENPFAHGELQAAVKMCLP